MTDAEREILADMRAEIRAAMERAQIVELCLLRIRAQRTSLVAHTGRGHRDDERHLHR